MNKRHVRALNCYSKLVSVIVAKKTCIPWPVSWRRKLHRVLMRQCANLILDAFSGYMWTFHYGIYHLFIQIYLICSCKMN